MNEVENLRDTIVPNSQQLNADDLLATTKIIKITAVKRCSSAEQPVSVEYEGMTGNPFKPCKSMRRVLIASWGENGRDWVGRSMNLFCDPDVKFGGVKVGGIRISHLSHIENDMKILISTSRGKRSDYVVKKLQQHQTAKDIQDNKSSDAKPSDSKILPDYTDGKMDENIDVWASAINSGKHTPESIIDMISSKHILSDDQKNTIRLLKKED